MRPFVTDGAVAGYGAIAQGGGIILLHGGSVTTTGTGERNHGLYTFDRGLIVADAAFGEVRTSGPTSHGALAQSGVIQLNGTTIVTTGAGSHGILAEPFGGQGGRVYPTGTTDPNPVATGDVTVIFNGNVTASGQSSRGIFANASTGGNAYVETSSAVLGGWGSGAAGVHLVYGLNGFARINAGSTVGALSDLAISGTTTGVGGTIQIENAGTVTGFVQFGGGDNSFLNNGLFDLRHFADTNGDGGRDTLRVAIADLGTGPANIFTNNGTLALPAVTGATTLDNTGQYLPQGNALNAMALGGPVQGQIVGASSFVNSGVINLQANPVPGDVLVITGARTAGSFGGGNFVSNGGSLRLDTVLNDGVPSQSDVLVVDGAAVGTGPTGISVRNAGGAGDLTVGNGILLVETVNGGTTPAGTFGLAGAVAVGPYEYFLFRGGVTPGNENNWYLRNVAGPIPPEPPTPTPGPTPGPTPPTPGPTPGPSPIPIPFFRPEAVVYAGIPSLARSVGLETLGTFHERQGEQSLLTKNGAFPIGWGRVFRSEDGVPPRRRPRPRI